MLRTIWFYSFLVVFTALTGIPLVLWYILGWLGQQDTQRRLGHYVSYNWARGLVAASGAQVHITGLENLPQNSAVLFVSNHQSNFDVPIILGCIRKPKAYVTKIELSNIPVLSTWMKNIGCVFINRQDIRQSLKVMNEAAEIMRAGQSMVIFPEGTRSKSSTMAEFKKGSLKLAGKAGVPIVPVSINGSYKIMEANGGRIKPALVELVVGQPIYFNELDKEARERLHDTIRDTIMENMK
jgi:1-acyl-sn-glycerol-3-phosphate acyltransferase